MEFELIKEDDDYVVDVKINGVTYSTEDGERVIIPKSVLKDIRTENLSEDIIIEVCDKMDDNMVFLSTVPYSLKKVNNSKILVLYEDSGTRKYWDGKIGFKLYMETKRDIIVERQKELGDVCFENYNDDGNYIFLNYTAEITADTCEVVIEQAEQIAKEVEGATELTLGSPFAGIEEAENESDFTISTLLPLIRKLGFSNVRYNHGKREYGKDIIFSRKTEFDEYEHWGVQVKFGNVSGGANSEIDGLIAQANDAFKMPYYDVYTRSKQRISKLIIAISGKFTENAIEKICEKIESYPLKNNIVFVDGEKIKSLSERFRSII